LKFDDLSLDFLELLLPGLLLLLLELLFLLLEFLELLLLLVGHVVNWLEHPVLFDELTLELVLFLFEDEFGASHHLLETSLSDVVTSQGGFSFSDSLSLGFLSGKLFSSVELFYLYFTGVNIEDQIWVLERVVFSLENVNFLL
jgi:hypothetical protein